MVEFDFLQLSILAQGWFLVQLSGSFATLYFGFPSISGQQSATIVRFVRKPVTIPATHSPTARPKLYLHNKLYSHPLSCSLLPIKVIMQNSRTARVLAFALRHGTSCICKALRLLCCSKSNANASNLTSSQSQDAMQLWIISVMLVLRSE